MGSEPTELDRLSDQWIETMLELGPELHVELGRPGREGEYSDFSPDGHSAAAGAAQSMLARVDATSAVDPDDAVTRSELLRVLGLAVEQHDAGLWRRDLNVIASPPQHMRDIFDLMPTDTDEHWQAVATRLANLPAAMDGYVTSLRSGVSAGDTPAIRQVQEVAEQARRLTGDTSFFASLVARADGRPASLRRDLSRGATLAREAHAHLVDVLLTEVAPAARTEDAVGRDHYALASRGFIGATVDLDETYEWGLDELARMVAEQEAVAEQIAPGAGVAGAIAALDAADTHALHGTEALQRWMQETSDRAIAELSGTFDIPEELRRLECCIAPTQEGGIYYTAPSEDFSRPGRMWWSVPEGITRFDTWRELTTVYHEGVPGHHLQLGTAIHPDAGLNAWRALNWNSGHGEGWALYAERLMADLGYLDDPADRLGMLDGQRMRAARVVLDIGVHLGKPHPDGDGPWTGERAFEFMGRHVSMNAPFVRFEVLRYLGWAGQAPSYKVGQRIWEQLRDAWVARHGTDLREFHRRALAHGSIGLETLRDTLLPDPGVHQDSRH
ncbi:DUF885 domain-containing protein [Aeromicrobium sp. CF4.19]|uniref:DUF885 domain-containing protein n=1 Tax=Aeromicrobium sp. CF4.19 TaxID=3373082 RepID=UPI003EE6BACE